jgi:DNA repair exonuclease SbcCD nuclease subunit
MGAAEQGCLPGFRFFRMTLTFLHAADVHLDSPLKGLERYDEAPVEEVRHATRRALENLVGLAIDESVGFVLIAGDLYDGDWRDFRTGRFFVAQMARLREAGIPAVVIAGNHDAANRMTKDLRLPENVRLLSHARPETVHLEEIGVAIHGQSFAKAAVTSDLSAGYPAAVPGLFNVGLLHTSATGREGHEPYAPCTVEGLRAKDYQYWALGHVHRREVLCDDPPIVFPGNLQGRHVRESGAKGCTLVRVDHDRIVHLEPRSIDVFRWETCRLDASTIDTGDDLLDLVGEKLDRLAAQAEGRPLGVRVEIEGPSTVHATVAGEPMRWEHEIRAAGQDAASGNVWIEKVKLRTSPPADLDPARWADLPIAELIGCLDEARSDPARLKAMGRVLAPLVDKLPRELVEGSAALGLDTPEGLRETLDQVEPMLLRRLLSEEGRA